MTLAFWVIVQNLHRNFVLVWPQIKSWWSLIKNPKPSKSEYLVFFRAGCSCCVLCASYILSPYSSFIHSFLFFSWTHEMLIFAVYYVISLNYILNNILRIISWFINISYSSFYTKFISLMLKISPNYVVFCHPQFSGCNIQNSTM